MTARDAADVPSGWYGICSSYGLDILGRQPVFSGEMDELAIETEYRAVSSLAEACRACRDHVEYRLDIVRRACNNAQHFGSRILPSKRFPQFPSKLNDLCFCMGRGGIATASKLWRIAALWRCRLAASRLSQFAGCFRAPPHRHPKGSGHADFQGAITPGICARRNGV
jgi:hypothetical protein